MRFVDPSQIPELPLPFMNEDHAEEIRLLEALGEALEAHRARRGSLDAVLERLSLLAVHTREHFLREEQVMRETGFPAYPQHKGEHDRVLAEMDGEARAFREGGDPVRLRGYLFETVPAWFVQHIRTMDAMTARFVASRPGAPGAAAV
ncbi:bacteriohemerythrin [Anaeromyxobacter sp. PSR-1]|uniref:bacteriohemerythrin n=1 Tax=unclassified Anaeromyxobacter TaxID=2620896 RepID=UPI0005EA1F91|nr:hemerythrin family protein [Anaeromyxobacter sp. PSR-1]GAO03918.1 bacteriohemerythrin [Anaeromyxobacter sp. PSR-1]